MLTIVSILMLNCKKKKKNPVHTVHHLSLKVHLVDYNKHCNVIVIPYDLAIQ